MDPIKYSKLTDAEKCEELKDCDSKENVGNGMKNGVFCEFLIILVLFLSCILLLNTTFANNCLFSKLYNSSRSNIKLPQVPKEYHHQSYVEIDEIYVEEDIVYQDLNPNAPVPRTDDSLKFIRNGEEKLCQITNDRKFDCYPESGSTQKNCEARGCCWHSLSVYKNKEEPEGVPYCFYPLKYPGYIVDRKESKRQGYDVYLNRTAKSAYPDDIMSIKLEIKLETSTRLHIKILDRTNQRWEVPINGVNELKAEEAEDNLYTIHVADIGQPFGFNVSRNGAGAKMILETAGAFIFADQFIQLSYFLSSHFIYGLGEHRDNLQHSTNWSRFTMWNKDSPPVENSNLYGTHPFYLMLEEDGLSHGVLLLNSNAMDVILQPAPAITWRTIGGLIDLYVFLGPNPDDVIQQYTELIGRTFMPPYWSLGFHVCRWGYKTVNGTMNVVDRIAEYGIPQDVQWNDIDYMDAKKDFVTDLKGFGNQGAMVDTLHQRGMHYMMIVDPGISSTATPGKYEPLDLGLSLDIFIKDYQGNPLEGKVWPGLTYFPDFTHPNSQNYWTTIAKNFHSGVKYDGMWIDMNEISNFLTGSTKGCSASSKLDNPPFLPDVHGKSLQFSTICASAQQNLSSQYNLHNLYGLTETIASYNALKDIRGKRPFIISRATFVGQGKFGGHWTGDNEATFYDMYKSISESLSMNMFGISIVGADICGFRDNTTDQLCQRWHQLGAFYTFSRNHNELHAMAQDPAAFGAALAESTKKVYLTRYTLLPYLYTLIHKSHMMGHTVLRPLFFEYPKDNVTYKIDMQFLWGPALLISPVLNQDETKVAAYFPKDVWYDFYSGELLPSGGEIKVLYAPFDKINLHVRGGYILPWQYPNRTTTHSRKNKFGLLVALNCTSQAAGDLFWDDGDTIGTQEQKLFNTISFSANKNGVYCNPEFIGYKEEPMFLGNVTVFGVASKPPSVTVNGKATNFNYNPQYKVLYVIDFNSTLLQAVEILF